MDFMGAHLLADRFARRIVAGPFLQDEDIKTPAKEPAGGPFDQNSFNDDPGALAPPKPLPTKPTLQPQPPMPWEVPASQVPGENGKPPLIAPNLAEET